MSSDFSACTLVKILKVKEEFVLWNSAVFVRFGWFIGGGLVIVPFTPTLGSDLFGYCIGAASKTECGRGCKKRASVLCHDDRLVWSRVLSTSRSIGTSKNCYPSRTGHEPTKDELTLMKRIVYRIAPMVQIN